MKEEIPALTQPPPSGTSPAAPSSAAESGAASDHSSGASRDSASGSAAPPGAPPTSPGPHASAPKRDMLAIVVALVAVVVAALAGWQVLQLRSSIGDIRGEIAQRLSASDAVLAEARGLSRQQQESIAALHGKIGALESNVSAIEGQAASLENLYQEFSRSRDDRVVAEVEQAINMAAQQLQLAGNQEAALIALQGADARLAEQDRGQFQSLRRALGRDIERLKAAPQVDVPGIALRLETLLERVDTLPLAFAGQLGETASADSGEGAEPVAKPSVMDFISRTARDVWREIRSLVRIERLDQSEPVLLAPAQSTYLRENLKIRLLTARLALLARDGRTYAADLTRAHGWIERFFDQRDPTVQDTLAELAALRSLPVKVEPPMPTESYAALRMLLARSGDRNLPAMPGSAPLPDNGAEGGAASPSGAAQTPPPASKSAPAPQSGASAPATDSAGESSPAPSARSGTPAPVAQPASPPQGSAPRPAPQPAPQPAPTSPHDARAPAAGTR